MTPRNETALSRKTAPEPAAATTNPPSAGPAARATLKPTELSETAAEAEEESEGQKKLRRGEMEHRQDTQPERGPQHPALAEDQQPTAVHYVSQRPRRQRQQEYRERFRRLNQRDHQRRWRKLRHQPTRAHLVHPRAHVGGHGSDPQDAEKLLPQRDPGGSHRPELLASGFHRQGRAGRRLSRPGQHVSHSSSE